MTVHAGDPTPDPHPRLPWSRWWVPAVVAAATLPLISVFGPQYGDLQRAENVRKVGDIVGNDEWRYALAALVDCVFAAAYGLAAFALSKRASLGWAPLGFVAGAVLDELENAFVLYNVFWARSTTVDIMRGLGTMKWWALGAGAVVLVVAGAVLWYRRSKLIPPDAQLNIKLAVAFLAYVVALAAFAGAVRVAAPVPAIVGLGMVCAYALGRLSSADRRADGKAGPFLLVLMVSAEVVAVSVRGDLPDALGFAALGAALYAIVRSIDHARRTFTGWELRAALSIVAVAGYLVALAPVDALRIGGALTVIGAGAAALELSSASYPRRLSENRLLTGFAGVLVLVVVTLAVLAINRDPVITSVIVAAVLVATALLITANDAWILVGVLLLAALWSGLPRSASLPEGQKPAGRAPYFAVLGDSYISGEGTDRYFAGTNTADKEAGNQCRRSPSAWPMLLNPPQTHDTGDVLGIPERVLNHACSGAVTADIRQVADARKDPEQLADLPAAIQRHGSPVFVVVSIGGNDAQFSDIGAACVLPGNCTDFLAGVREKRLEAVGDEVARTHAEIRQAVGPDVPVIAVPYPMALHEGTSCEGVVLSKGDIVAINEFIVALNAEVQAATTTTGSLYMGTMAGALADSAAQLCDPHGRSGLNFADFNPKAGSLWATVNPKNWTHNFIHPNEDGHAALRAAAVRWFAANPCVLARTCSPVVDSTERRQLATQPAGLPDKVENDGLSAIADVVPMAVLVLAFLTLAWWLVITAFRPPKERVPPSAGEEATTRAGEVATAARPQSVLEKITANLSPTPPEG